MISSTSWKRTGHINTQEHSSREEDVMHARRQEERLNVQEDKEPDPKHLE